MLASACEKQSTYTHTLHINFSDCHLSIAFQLILKLGTLIPCVRIISSVCIYLYSHWVLVWTLISLRYTGCSCAKINENLLFAACRNSKRCECLNSGCKKPSNLRAILCWNFQVSVCICMVWVLCASIQKKNLAHFWIGQFIQFSKQFTTFISSNDVEWSSPLSITRYPHRNHM